MSLFLAIALLAALVTCCSSLVVRFLTLKYRLFPKIRDRDVHTRVTPRLGGAAMFLGVLAGFVGAWLVAAVGPQRFSNLAIVFQNPSQVLAILGASLLIVIVGIADDLWDLDWLLKLGGQIAAAAIIAWQGVTVYSLPIGGITVGSSWMSAIVTMCVAVLVMNAVNFMDGLDGLVAGLSLIANGVFLLYTYLLVQATSPTNYFNLASVIAAVLVGACGGFLPLNWHRAKMFMGDGGALLVGLLMATSAISVTGQLNPRAVGFDQLFAAFIPIVLPIVVLAIPLLDFGLAVTRRLRAGLPPFAADRQHLHHRLLDMGHSHLGAVLIFYAWATVASVGCLLTYVFPVYLGVSSVWALVILGVGFVVCGVFTVAPRARRARRSDAEDVEVVDVEKETVAVEP